MFPPSPGLGHRPLPGLPGLGCCHPWPCSLRVPASSCPQAPWPPLSRYLAVVSRRWDSVPEAREDAHLAAQPSPEASPARKLPPRKSGTTRAAHEKAARDGWTRYACAKRGGPPLLARAMHVIAGAKHAGAPGGLRTEHSIGRTAFRLVSVVMVGVLSQVGHIATK